MILLSEFTLYFLCRVKKIFLITLTKINALFNDLSIIARNHGHLYFGDQVI